MSARALLLGSGGGDQFFASVSLLAFNDNAANGTTTFLDQSNNNRAISRTGSTIAYSNAQAPTGMTTSVSFPSAAANLLSVSGIAFGTANFTFEYWYRYAALPGLYSAFDGRDLFGSFGGGIVFQTDGGSNLKLYYGSGPTLELTVAVTSGWHHYALVCNGATNTFYIDGASVGTFGGPLTLNNNNISYIGNDATSASAGNGNMASLRLTPGVVRYTANFTPPLLPLPTHL